MGFRYATGRLYKPKAVAGGGWWDLDGAITSCIAAYQPKGAVDYTASKVNLANPGTYNATEGVAPTWDTTTGWTGDGASKYLDTGITVTDDETHTLIFRYSGHDSASSTYDCTFGVDTAKNEWGFINRSNRPYIMLGGTITQFGTITMNEAVVCVAGLSLYVNGGYRGAHAGGNVNGTIKIGRIHYGGVQKYFYANYLAAAIYNAVLTSDQISALTTAMNAL